MTTRFETTRQTKAPLSKAIDYFMHPENIPKIHPGFVKDVKILSREGDTITLEEYAEMMGKKIKSIDKLSLNRKENRVEIDTIEGDGKGSRVTITLKEVPTGTEVKYSASLELGPLGFFAKGPAKSTFERTADEDAKALDGI
jgi:hypothetical protein